MDPRFECPFCGAVVRYDSRAGDRAVTFDGIIRFRAPMLRNRTFCSLHCLLAYLEKENHAD